MGITFQTALNALFRRYTFSAAIRRHRDPSVSAEFTLSSRNVIDDWVAWQCIPRRLPIRAPHFRCRGEHLARRAVCACRDMSGSRLALPHFCNTTQETSKHGIFDNGRSRRRYQRRYKRQMQVQEMQSLISLCFSTQPQFPTPHSLQQLQSINRRYAKSRLTDRFQAAARYCTFHSLQFGSCST